MRKTSYLVLSFFTLICFSISPSLANTQMNISSVGRVTYPAPSGQIKILRQSFHRSTWSVSRFASIIDVYQGHYDTLSVVPQIKAIRSDVLAFVYYNTVIVWRENHAEYDAAKLQLFIDNNWILKDSSGSYIDTLNYAGYFVDFGNPAYHTWLANWYNNYVNQYQLDGASLDNVFWDSTVWWCKEPNGKTPINPRTGSAFTNQQICDAYKQMTIKIRDTLGSAKHVLINGIYNGNHFYAAWRNPYFVDGMLHGGQDAVMSEGWLDNRDASVWMTYDNWLKSINMAVWLEDNFPAAGGQFFMPICCDYSWWGNPPHGYPTDMTQEEYEQYATYCYASGLLTIKTLKTMFSFGYYIAEAYPQSLFKINIGTPSESHHTLGSSNVYARKFTEGMVLVNPTYDAYIVTIDSEYKNAVTGNSVSSPLTVQPHTGLILTKV
jgi:hypothetical protein